MAAEASAEVTASEMTTEAPVVMMTEATVVSEASVMPAMTMAVTSAWHCGNY